jgi:hypothetical protein
MTMRPAQPKPTGLDRRRLLKGVGLAAGAAAASSTVAAKEAGASGGERKPRSSASYRETADVRAYYKSARY